jgi:FkbM family methyltransferase
MADIVLRDRVWLSIASYYSRLYVVCHRRLGINLRGLGWILRHLQSGQAIHVAGMVLYLEPAVASSYGVLVGGKWNEPETHKFLRLVNDALPSRFSFVDVGANIGAMALDVARLSKTRNVIAIEPNHKCVEAIEKSSRMNGFTNIRIVEAALTAEGNPVSFLADLRHANASHLGDKPSELSSAVNSRIVAGMTLDSLRDDVEPPCIILIDVEGAEIEVLRGGRKVITELKPLIVFEFNEVSRRHFSLEEVVAVLGPGYEIFRLNSLGQLDKEFSNTWNCCAVPSGTVFHEILPYLSLKTT